MSNTDLFSPARPRLRKEALAAALQRAILDACNSPDLATINAAWVIIDREAAGSLAGLLRTISYDPADFILVAAPGVSRALKQATGRSRDEWASLLTRPSPAERKDMRHPSYSVGPIRGAFTLAELSDDAARWHPQRSVIVTRTNRSIAKAFAGLWGT